MKRDGHTHTEFCPHGSGDDVEQYIRKAIADGFTEYSITEHTPLPKSYIEKAPEEGREAFLTSGMRLGDVEYYLKKMHQLKKKYASDIKLYVGFEVDYLPGFEDWTTDFLNEYGRLIDDSILSLHFLEGNDGLRSIDFSAEDYNQGIVQYYGSFQKAQEKYLQVVMNSIQADLGQYKPKRIGHITLCQKFKGYFKNEDTSISETSLVSINKMFDLMKDKNYEIDFNTAGLFKEYCGETYPPKNIMALVLEKGIPFVYGSDAHSINDVGRGYENFNKYNVIK